MIWIKRQNIDQDKSEKHAAQERPQNERQGDKK